MKIIGANITGSFIMNGNDVTTAIQSANTSSAQITSLNAFTASIFAYTASTNLTIADILAETASINNFSASVLTYTASINTITSSFATTGSNTFTGNQTVQGTLTAQTLIVQTITSSVSNITGSTIFGSIPSNTHQFTGSVNITGSLGVTGSINATAATHSFFGRVGINTLASNIDALWVSGSIGFSIGDGGLTFADRSGNDLRIYTPSGATRFVDGTGLSTFLTIQSSNGNVGIGTTSPNDLLEIKSTTANQANVRLYNTFNDGSNAYGISWFRNYDSATNSQACFINYIREGGSGGYMSFGTGTVGAISSRMIITSGGNVTINNLVTSNRLSFSLQSHGTKIVSDGNVSSSSFNLNTIFPEATNLVGGNVWGVFGKITIFRGGSAETGLFSLCRNGAGSWSSAAYATQTATGAYSLSNITGSGASITFTFNTAIYFIAEITVMAS